MVALSFMKIEVLQQMLQQWVGDWQTVTFDYTGCAVAGIKKNVYRMLDVW